MRPNDERGILHKRILGGIGGFISGGPVGAAAGFFGGGKNGAPFPFTGGGGTGGSLPLPFNGGEPSLLNASTSTIVAFIKNNFSRLSHATLAKITGWTAAQIQATFDETVLAAAGGNGVRCEPPFIPSQNREFCVFPGSPAGGQEFLKGRFGPAMEPSFRTVNVRDCDPGQILGKDFLCYESGAISNKERLYPRGTRPLLTGGEMRAIAKASAAESKIRTVAARLGVCPKPPRKRAPAGHKAKLVHA